MLRWLLLSLSLALAALASLTVFWAPTLTGWKCAILAGEFGHVLIVLPLGLLAFGAWRWTQGGRGIPEVAVLILSMAAVVGFARPSVSAWRIARTLPGRLEAAFGPGARMDRKALSLRLLVSGEPIQGSVETLTYAGGDAPLRLDFYRAQGRALAPCVILVHGGGWDSGQRDELPWADQFLAAHGYAVASIDYRLAPASRWPEPKTDVREALSYLKAHAASLGINPATFVLFGRSAGGQIAVASAYELADPSIRGVISFYAPHDLRYAWSLAKPDDVLNSGQLLRQYTGGSPEDVPDAYDGASGILHVTPGVPPTLLVHGALDTLVWNKQSERLNAVLDRAHVPHLFVSLPWATHAFDYNLNGPGGQIAMTATLAFLKAETE